MMEYLDSLDEAELLWAARSLLISAYILLNLCILWHHVPTPVPAGIQLDLYETAVLSHNEATTAAITTAALRLIQRGVLGTIFEPRQLQVEGPLPEGSHPLEEAVYRAASEGGAIERVHLAAQPVAQGIYLKVRSLGLIYSSVLRTALFVLFLLIWIPLIVAVLYLANRVDSNFEPIPVIGASVVGLLGSPGGSGAFLAAATLFPERLRLGDRERSERWMSFSTVGAFMIVFILNVLVLVASPCTRRGQSLLTRLQRQHRDTVDSDPAWMVALYGIEVLKGSRYAYLKDFFNPPPPPPDNSNPC